ncbi:MAG: hypothetical protein ABI573_08830 [Chloroflexota bacterium]
MRAPAASRGSSWIAGAALGLLAGFLLLESPLFGLVVLSAAAVLVAVKGDRNSGFGGLLIGLGGTWTLLLGRVKFSCTVNSGCAAPTIDTYLAIGIAILVLGSALSLGAVRARCGRN